MKDNLAPAKRQPVNRLWFSKTLTKIKAPGLEAGFGLVLKRALIILALAGVAAAASGCLWVHDRDHDDHDHDHWDHNHDHDHDHDHDDHHD